MNESQSDSSNYYKLIPIGKVIKINQENPYLEIYHKYADGIYRLETISHIFVLWWIHENDKPELRKTKGSVCPRVSGNIVPPEEMGTFATRSPHRPNPIGLTLVKIKAIKNNKIYVDSIDAFDETPIIDIKPYLPNGDRVESVILPKWFDHLKESRPQERT